MNIRDILFSSYDDALKAMVMGTSPESLARARERAFVKTLAAHVEDACEADDIRVFSQYGRGNLADFGAERLLYDIEVCRIATSSSADRKKETFLHIASALWQIEIDFSCDWRHSVYALNRLCCGGAENKTIIAAHRDRGRQILIDTLAPVAAASAGQLHLVLIPHPRDWAEVEHPLELWALVDAEWQPVT